MGGTAGRENISVGFGTDDEHMWPGGGVVAHNHVVGMVHGRLGLNVADFVCCAAAASRAGRGNIAARAVVGRPR